MQPTLNMELPELEWITLLRAEQAKGKPIAQIARECGMARSSVSMILAGTYPAQSLDLVTQKNGSRIVQLYRGAVLCPHLHRSITPDDCRAFASTPMSTSRAEKLRHWRACRRCPLNPLKTGEK